MAKKKVNRAELVKKVKQMKVEKENYTFRLPIDLMDEFKRICNKEGINRTDIITELLKDFVCK